MRAAVYHGQKDIRIENTSTQAIGPKDVNIEIAYCGICGSDVHEYVAGPIAIPEDSPHPLTNETLPVTLGHEFSGIVTEVGDEVTSIESGDRVTVNPAIWCGTCQFCNRGLYHLCASGGSIGLAGGDGGLAERAVVPEAQVVPVPDEVSLEHAALTEPYAVALHAVRKSSLRPGDDTAVFGAGPIGLAVAQCTDVAGANQLFISEPQEIRRIVAERIGAKTINPEETNPVHKISAKTNGGVSVAYEAAGVETALQQAIRTTIKSGQVILISVFEEPAAIQPNFIMMAERSVVGSIAYETGPQAAKSEFADVLSLFAEGRLNPEPLITSKITLDKVVKEGFEALTGSTEQIKILVSP